MNENQSPRIPVWNASIAGFLMGLMAAPMLPATSRAIVLVGFALNVGALAFFVLSALLQMTLEATGNENDQTQGET